MARYPEVVEQLIQDPKVLDELIQWLLANGFSRFVEEESDPDSFMTSTVFVDWWGNGIRLRSDGIYTVAEVDWAVSPVARDDLNYLGS